MKQMKKSIFVLIAFFLIVMKSGMLVAKSSIPAVTQNVVTLHPVLAKAPPKLDGSLDDEIWKSAALIDDNWITYNPLYGELLPQKTRAFLAYDPDNLYFAFYCHDLEPAKIKTSICRRDNQWNDDWVGISLDAVGNKQSGYDLFVNPNGIQGDIYRTANGEDSTTDWVWYSAGKVVEDGYVVEIRVPLKNIRFSSGKQVDMGILFWRRISRLGISGAWPQLSPGQGVFSSQARMVFDKLDNQLKLEALPSFTTGGIWDRVSPEKWSAADRSTNLGLGLKYGITSSITSELTLNPDFSQVESDSFQIVANQRYPVFYEEKRPFFMELGNIFSIAGYGGSSNVTTVVHTRTIVSPVWGVKLSGETGRTAFGFLGVSDDWPGRSQDGETENPDLGKKAYNFVGRGKFSLGGENYIGAIYSGREFAGSSNRFLGTDLSLLFLRNHSLKLNYLYSFSDRPATGGKTQGQAMTALYNFQTRAFNFGLRYEQFGKDFQMDTAFMQRTGFDRYRLYLNYNLFPNAQKLSWFKLFGPYLLGQVLHDKLSGLDDDFVELGVNMNFTKQGYFSLFYNLSRECWANRVFDSLGKFSVSSGIQLNKWLFLHACGGFGDSIYYDPVDPFPGKSWNMHNSVTLQLNGKLNSTWEYVHTGFRRADTGEKVYNVNIVRSRVTYQFNRFLFVRGLLQYDSYRKVVMSDLLASFTLIPGTVIHLGYGSLNEKCSWQDDQWQKEIAAGKYVQTRQSLFLKVSYLLQF